MSAGPDTVYLADSTTGFEVDLSQIGTDIVDATTWFYESASTRAATGSRRTVDIVLGMSTSTSGYLFAYNTNHGILYASGSLRLVLGGTTILTMPITLTGSEEICTVSWATEPNPDTTGAGDLLRSELHFWNSAHAYQTAVVLHGALPSTGAMTWFASRTTGANVLTNATPYGVRLSKDFHSSTETYRTLIAARGTVSLAGEARLESPVPTRASGLGDAGNFGGPVYLMAARAVHENDLRMAGPMINELIHPALMTNSTNMVAWDGSADTTFRIFLSFMARRPVPQGANKVAWRVFVQCNTSAQLRVRAYSMSQPGYFSRPDTSPATFESYYRELSVAEHHGVDLGGVWLEFPPSKIARDLENYTYLCLGFLRADSSQWRVKAIVCEPIYDPSGGDLAGAGGGFA
jgi:hypothetical protein